MSVRDVIQVIGATGKVGRQVVSRLVDAGAAVRALARDPGAAGLPAGVDVVRGDLARPETVEAALDGVSSVFLVWPFLTADAAPAVLDVVRRHARHVVYLSSMGGSDGRGGKTAAAGFHADMERLIEKSGLAWTFLRPSGFAANTLGWAAQIRAGGVVHWPHGAASRSLIHERDIAGVAALALTGDGHDGARYLLTGPERITQVEQVAAIGEAIGRHLRYEEIPSEPVRDQLLASGWTPEFANSALQAWAAFVNEPEVVTTTVHELTGRPARRFQEWATDHADDFR
ncbi:MAG: NAD(P)H-binding protein [Sciscionella sp.]